MKTVLCDHCHRPFMVADNSREKVCEICEKKHRAEYHATQYNKGKAKTRVCHDCGKPTPDYRCPECRTKWRKKHGVGGWDVPTATDLSPYNVAREQHNDHSVE